MGRFINADALVTTGQGLLGNNMFVYCLNNPIAYVDVIGTNPIALQWWTFGMGWLPYIDIALPIADIIYIGGVLVLGAIALTSEQHNIPVTSYVEVDAAFVPPSPNDNDDNDDDDSDEENDEYYDDSNFGGRQKMGKSNGNTPRNNQAQNKQFRDATKGLTKDMKRRIHQEISRKGKGFQEIKEIVDSYSFTQK